MVKAGFAVKVRGFEKVQSGELFFCVVRSEKWWSMGRVGEILLCFLELLGVKRWIFCLDNSCFLPKLTMRGGLRG